MFERSDILLNLDEQVPADLVRRINSQKRLSKMAPPPGAETRRYLNNDRVHISGSYNAPGIDPDKLFDWRKLEARTSQLQERYLECQNVFWGTLKELSVKAKKAGAKKVWIYDERQPNYVQVYDDGGLCSEDYNRLVKESIGNPEKKALVIKGDAARKLNALRARELTCMRRWGVYQRAFQYAVEARLKDIVQNKLRVSEIRYHYYKKGVFSLTNEDRTYIITTDEHGVFKWEKYVTMWCV